MLKSVLYSECLPNQYGHIINTFYISQYILFCADHYVFITNDETFFLESLKFHAKSKCVSPHIEQNTYLLIYMVPIFHCLTLRLLFCNCPNQNRFIYGICKACLLYTCTTAITVWTTMKEINQKCSRLLNQGFWGFSSNQILIITLFTSSY